jgi:hypothetical protein
MFTATAATAGPANLSANNYNLESMASVFRLNSAALRNDTSTFQKLVVPGAQIQGLQSLDHGQVKRPLAIDGIRLLLSKCVMSGITFLSSNLVTLQFRCVGEPTNSVDFFLSDEAQIEGVDFAFGAPPPMTNIVNVTDQ